MADADTPFLPTAPHATTGPQFTTALSPHAGVTCHAVLGRAVYNAVRIPTSHRSAKGTIAEIRRARSASLRRLVSWASHPDERVLVALLDRAEETPGLRINDVDREAVRVLLLAIAWRRAEADGTCWTALLDAIVYRKAWPHGAEVWSAETRALATTLPSLHALFARVTHWSAQASVEDLACGLQSRHPLVREAVMRGAAPMSDAAVALLARRPTLHALAVAPALTLGQQSQIADLAFAAIPSASVTELATYRYFDIVAQLGPHRFADAAWRRTLYASITVDGAQTGSRRERAVHAARMTLKYVAIYAPRTEWDLLLGAVSSVLPPHSVAAHLTARTAPPGMLLAALERSPSPLLREAAARNLRAPIALDVARLLLCSQAVWSKSGTDALTRLICALPRDEFARGFQELMDGRETEVLERIVSHPAPWLAVLTPEDLLTYFAHSDAVVRDRALAALGALSSADTAAGEPRHQASPVRMS